MDRFFSKLDLRDIKIDPEASFPPDEDAYTDDSLTDWTHGETSTGSVATETQPETDRSEVLKVSARSRPSAVAGAIAGVVRESGRALGVTVIPGVELGTEVTTGELHMLGYFIDPSSPVFQEALAAFRNARQ